MYSNNSVRVHIVGLFFLRSITLDLLFSQKAVFEPKFCWQLTSPQTPEVSNIQVLNAFFFGYTKSPDINFNVVNRLKY